jgi:hypothetical protein
MLRDDVAMTHAPIVFQTHKAYTRLAGQFRCLREGKLALRLSQSCFEDALHGFRIAAARRLASGLRRAQSLHVHVGDACSIQACSEHGFGKAGAARIGDGAHIHHRLHFCSLQSCDEIRNTGALIADGPDAAHCK